MKECLKENRWWICLTIVAGLINAFFSAFTAMILQRFIDEVTNFKSGNYSMVIFFGVGIFVYFNCAVLIYYIYQFLVLKISYKISAGYRKKIFNGIINKNYKTFYTHSTADYISDLTNNMNIIINDYIYSFFEIINNCILFLFTISLIFYYNYYIAGIMIICLILMISVPNFFRLIIEKRKKNYSEELSNFTNGIKDILSGFEVLFSYNVLNTFNKKIFLVIDNLEHKHLKSDNILNIVNSMSFFLANITQMIILFMGAYFIINGNLTVGVVVALIQLSGTFINPIMAIVKSYSNIKSTRPIVEKLDKLVLVEKQKNKKNFLFEKKIVLKDVSFEYNNTIVLKKVNFTFEKNKKYVIVGRNGCGKTTLLKLICGYYDTYNGSIKYEDTELKEICKSDLKDIISIVHQNIYLFNLSIKDNISLYKNYEEKDLLDAIKISGLESYIGELDKGIYTEVKENGENFSGGQKQRIALARAVLRHTPILVLDEGVSAVDGETAQEIEKRLLNMSNITLITVTHLLSRNRLKQYDCVIYMENGEIIEAGTFDELIAYKKNFFKFETSGRE